MEWLGSRPQFDYSYSKNFPCMNVTYCFSRQLFNALIRGLLNYYRSCETGSGRDRFLEDHFLHDSMHPVKSVFLLSLSLSFLLSRSSAPLIIISLSYFSLCPPFLSFSLTCFLIQNTSIAYEVFQTVSIKIHALRVIVLTAL